MHIAGWVEYKDERKGVDIGWMPLIFLSHLVSITEEALSVLLLQGATWPNPPLAQGLGLPEDVSRFVKRYWEMELEADDVGVLHDTETWITWGELKPITAQSHWSSDWQFLFALLDAIAEAHGSADVRLVRPLALVPRLRYQYASGPQRGEEHRAAWAKPSGRRGVGRVGEPRISRF